jgi:hypothetical protein
MNLKVTLFSNQFRTAFFVLGLLAVIAVFFLIMFWGIERMIILYQSITSHSYPTIYLDL